MLYRSVKITNAARMHLALKYFVLSYYYFYFTYYTSELSIVKFDTLLGLLLRGAREQTTKTNEIAESAIMRTVLAGNRLAITVLIYLLNYSLETLDMQLDYSLYYTSFF